MKATTGTLILMSLGISAVQGQQYGISTFAGNNPASNAGLSSPVAVALDPSGNLYLADYGNNRIKKVSAAGIVSTVAGNGSPGYSGDGGQATDAQLNGPGGVAVDSVGNLYIADTGNQRIRMVSAAMGIITTVAGVGPDISPMGLAVDSSGNLYFTDSYVGPPSCPLGSLGACNPYLYPTGYSRITKLSSTGSTSTVAGVGSLFYGGDSGPATSAGLSGPSGVAVDSNGNLYIADTGNQRVRMVSAATGIITTVAGSGWQSDSAGSGDGGPATSAFVFCPGSIAVDAGGSLYIGECGNVIRKVSGGIISTIAGNGNPGYSGDGGPAISAELNNPTGVAVDSSGNVYVDDSGNNAIRLLAGSGASCTYSVSPMTLLSPVAGGGFTLSINADAGCSWAIENLPDWITLSGSVTGSGSATVSFVAAPNSAPLRATQIAVAGITVTVSQASNVLELNVGGVVNAASFGPLVAPGSIAAIFGSFTLEAPVSSSASPVPTSLGGLSLQFNGAVAAPLFYASMSQVNAQVPWEMAGQPVTYVTASIAGQTTWAMVNLGYYAPGIFTVSGAGTGQGVILDANDNLVDAGNPAHVGDTVRIFCTGIGPVSHPPPTGAPAPLTSMVDTLTTPTVSIGGTAATVTFSGLAPGQVGVYQVNAQVPAGAAKGSAVPVMITIVGAQSNVATMAVQ